MLHHAAPPALVAAGVLMLASNTAMAGDYHDLHFEGDQQRISDACRPDYWRYCRGVVPGRGRILSCLAGNRDRLSRPCGYALITTFGPPRLAYEERWTGQFVTPPEDRGVDAEEPLK